MMALADRNTPLPEKWVIIESAALAGDNSLMRMLFEASQEPQPHVVHYDNNRTTYTPPHLFHFTIKEPAPSDCVWFVPGTF